MFIGKGGPVANCDFPWIEKVGENAAFPHRGFEGDLGGFSLFAEALIG